jgi:hypothetical protein
MNKPFERGSLVHPISIYIVDFSPSFRLSQLIRSSTLGPSPEKRE